MYDAENLINGFQNSKTNQVKDLNFLNSHSKFNFCNPSADTARMQRVIKIESLRRYAMRSSIEF